MYVSGPLTSELRMKILLIFTLLLISDLSYEKNISVTGHVGGSVNISCKYPQSHSSNPKFLCRRVGSADCSYETSVNESRRWINEGKLNLHDDGKQIFTVIINSLTEEDSGEYWCGAESDRTSDHGYKVYITQINITVTDSPPPAFPVSSVVTGVSVVLLLLLIGLLFFIVTFRKRRKTRESAEEVNLPPISSQHPAAAAVQSQSQRVRGNMYVSGLLTSELRMKILLIFTLLLISGGGESERVTGYSGGGVLIKCTYETNYTSNQKYFCKRSWSNCADQIKTGDENEWINRGRFSLFDDTRAAQFWVMIRELTVEDSGLYQCGVDIILAIDIHTPVELKVEEDQEYEKSISVAGHVGGSVNISCKYPQSHSSDPKFLCRMMGKGGCLYKSYVNESRRWIKQGKVSLYDTRVKKIFTVSFNNLTEGDSGEYWCGAESNWTSDHGYKAYIKKINLRVPGE
ncbi:hypothetical protein MHYP_G00103770 [Metynnis hypsauchen]